MYKFHDESGNVFMWSTGNSLNTEYPYQIVGTVKSHEEYKGTKQTWLTRCRTTKLDKDIDDTSSGDVRDAEDAIDTLLDETFN